MEEIFCKINRVGSGQKIFSDFVRNLFILCFLLSVILASKVYAQGELLSVWLWNSSKNTSANIRVGDVLDLEVWINVGEVKAQGISIYLTFDENYFEVTNLKGDEKQLKPFDFGNGLFGGSVTDNSTHGDPGNNIAKFQLDGGTMFSGTWVTGQGMIARFQLRAINKVDNTQITIDYDRGQHRDTRIHEYPLNEFPFIFRHNFGVSIEGIGVSELPDVLLLPGQTDNNTVLNDYLINPPGDLSTLRWTYSKNQDSLLVSIDANTTRVTYSSIEGWVGEGEVTFTVTDLTFGITGQSTVSVGFTFPPEIINLPEVIIFPEDYKYETFDLNFLINDADDPPDSIDWSASSLTAEIFIEYLSDERKFLITSRKNWFGSGNVMFITEDPNGAKDSLVVPVRVTAVNDAPVITGLPDEIIMRPSKIDTFIVLNDYVLDIDHTNFALLWSYSGNDQIAVDIDKNKNNLARFTPTTGFMGTEEIIFTVSDGSLEISDTINIIIGNEPPFVSDLPDTVIVTDFLTHNYVNLNDYATDDEPVELLEWDFEGDDIAIVFIDPDKNVTFNLTDESQWGVQKVIFTATDRDNRKSSDSISVVILSKLIPTVWGIPDIFIPVGESDNSINLDDYVWDKDTPRDKITWSYTGGQNITVLIDSLTHKVIISSTDLNFVGTSSVTFKATDPESNFREDVIIVNVLPDQGIPFIKDIPDVSITWATTDTRILDDYLVINPDSLRKNIKWEVFGSMEKVDVQINQQSKIATFGIGNDLNFLGEVTFRFEAINIVSNESRSKIELSTVPLIRVMSGKFPKTGVLPSFTTLTKTFLLLDSLETILMASNLNVTSPRKFRSLPIPNVAIFDC